MSGTVSQLPVAIAGTGSYVPERVLTNADLEIMVETSDEWITTPVSYTHLTLPTTPYV